MQRRERVQGLDLPEHRVIDHHRLAEPFAAMHHAMADHADFRRLANDARVLGRQLAQHRLEGVAVSALRKVARHFAGRPAMDETGAFDADAFDLAVRRVGFVLRIEEGVLERRRAAVDHEDLLRPLAFQTQAVGILALAKRGRRLGRIGRHLLEAVGDGLRDVLHRARARSG